MLLTLDDVKKNEAAVALSSSGLRELIISCCLTYWLLWLRSHVNFQPTFTASPLSHADVDTRKNWLGFVHNAERHGRQQLYPRSIATR